MNIENYDIGFNTGLTAMEAVSEIHPNSGGDQAEMIVGVLAAVMSAAYAMAPSETAACEAIAMANKLALINEKG
jgi:hypothetical protein